MRRETISRRWRQWIAVGTAALAFSFCTLHPGFCDVCEQTRWFVTYLRATSSVEEPMGWMERITVSYYLAGQRAGKAKEAGRTPASLETRI
jgi:hypothetical protein